MYVCCVAFAQRRVPRAQPLGNLGKSYPLCAVTTVPVLIQGHNAIVSWQRHSRKRALLCCIGTLYADTIIKVLSLYALENFSIIYTTGTDSGKFNNKN